MDKHEYRFHSRLGYWPEVFSSMEDLLDDLRWNQANYPDVEFTVQKRRVGPWEDVTETPEAPEPFVSIFDDPDLVEWLERRSI